MIPIYPAFNIVGEELKFIDRNCIWTTDVDKLKCVWDAINSYGGHAQYVGTENESHVFIVFSDSESEVAFKLRFGV